jgi:hypothetical protein
VHRDTWCKVQRGAIGIEPENGQKLIHWRFYTSDHRSAGNRVMGPELAYFQSSILSECLVLPPLRSFEKLKHTVATVAQTV